MPACPRAGSPISRHFECGRGDGEDHGASALLGAGRLDRNILLTRGEPREIEMIADRADTARELLKGNTYNNREGGADKMTISREELAKRVSDARQVLGSAIYSQNPTPWLFSALHKLFPGGHIDEVIGLNDSERGVFHELRDGPMIYITEGQTKGYVDWSRTMHHLRAARLEQVRGWAQTLIDFHDWLTVE